jgi:uroporphyrinogen-III decarboxylase
MSKTLLDASALMAKWGKTARDCRMDAMKAGFPILRGSFTTAPFDSLGDTLRGTQGIIMDMYRQPDKILEALEVITPLNLASAIAAADNNDCPIVSIPLHKGEDNFMSRSQYEKFYWPTFRRLLMGLINEGIVPYVFAEGKYNTRLDIIKDVPKGSMVWWFEATDMAQAKKHLGGIACIAGNVPASILLTGTPQDVKEYCRKTIEVAGAGGGLILNGAAFVHDGKAENLRAMTEASKEYGMY